MTTLFRSLRFTALLAAFAFASIVLGLSANFAAKFLPNHRDFLVFALVMSAATIVSIAVLSLRSTPAFELFMLFSLACVWCGMGGFSTDIIGYVQCDTLSGRIPAKNGTSYSAQGYCRQMKVLQTFSWAEFALFIILFLIVLNISLGASARGYKEIWNASISDLGWYGEEANGRVGAWPGAAYGGGVQPGVSYTYPNVQSFGGSQPVYQLPGHSVVITNGPDGQRIQQVPVVPGSPSVIPPTVV